MLNMYLLLTICLIHVEAQMYKFITGREPSKVSRYPHQVYLQISGTNPCVCGGSILNQLIILTSAHCLEDKDHHNVIVNYGSQYLEKMKSMSVRTVLLHEKYNMKTMYADVALIRVKKWLTLDKMAQRVAIMKNPPAKSFAYVSGWGAGNVSSEKKRMCRNCVFTTHPFFLTRI